MRKKSPILLGFTWIFLLGSAAAAPLDSLVKNLSKGASSLKNKKVAVLAFPYHNGRISSGSSVISERITTQIVGKRGIRVVERRLIEQILSEKKLSETGIVDQENLQTIGAVLEVDAVITGTLIDLANGKTEINARMIQANSGEVLAAGQEEIQRTWKDAPIMPRKKEVQAKPARLPESDTEAEIDVASDRSLPAPSEPAAGKTPMRLSNESFPPSRRLYHTREPGRPKKKPAYPSYEDRQGSYEKDDATYEDGYADAYRDATETNKKKTSSSPSYKSGNTYQEQTIQHPTSIGTVQTEGSSYGSSYYRKKSTR